MIALILLPVAILMCAYALVVFIWRAKAIGRKQASLCRVPPSGMYGAAVKRKLHYVQKPIPAAPWTSWQHGCSAWAVQLSKPTAAAMPCTALLAMAAMPH